MQEDTEEVFVEKGDKSPLTIGALCRKLLSDKDFYGTL